MHDELRWPLLSCLGGCLLHHRRVAVFARGWEPMVNEELEKMSFFTERRSECNLVHFRDISFYGSVLGNYHTIL
jgi:hypothetical protein